MGERLKNVDGVVAAVVVVVVVCVFCCLTFTFQLLDKLWSQVSSLLPPGTCLQFLSRIRFHIGTFRRFSSNVANSHFRAFRESICAQETVPTNLYEYALGGNRTHEIDTVAGTRITCYATGAIITRQGVK